MILNLNSPNTNLNQVFVIINTMWTGCVTSLDNVPIVEIRTGMDSQQECLDIRLKQQEQEVADLMDILKRRAEIEKKYSRDMESLSKTMRHKHKEMLGGGGSTRPTTVTNVLRELIAETGELARLHTRLDETLTGEMAGICSNILSDAQLQHKQVSGSPFLNLLSIFSSSVSWLQLTSRRMC